MKQKILWLALVLCTAGLSAQTAAPAPLPNGFEKMTLGMSMADLKKVLEGSPYLTWRGDPDVSLLNKPDTSLIDVAGSLYFKRALFQFYKDKLFIITLYFNDREFDYAGLYAQLTKKYGPHKTMDPSIARWDNGTVRMSLEKPLAIRYVDAKIFDELQKGAVAQESLLKITRDKFIESF